MSTVYFIQSIDRSGPIKIGCTNGSLPYRLHMIQAYSPVPLVVLATHGGGWAEERRLHQVFSGDRLYSEWFAPSTALLAWVSGCEKPDADALAEYGRNTNPGDKRRRDGSYYAKAANAWKVPKYERKSRTA